MAYFYSFLTEIRCLTYNYNINVIIQKERGSKMEATIYTPAKVEIDIKEVTLLSVEEARRAEENVPDILAATHDFWWLRSPGNSAPYAAGVCNYGSVYTSGYGVNCDSNGVRPALRISNLKSLHLLIGSKITVNNYSFTVVSRDLALCDQLIDHAPFNRDYKKGNVYETSDIKQVVDKWVVDNNITIQEGKKIICQRKH